MFGGVIQTKGKEWMTSMPPLPHFAAQSTYLVSNYPLLTQSYSSRSWLPETKSLFGASVKCWS
jgi:hypothetical protein